MSDTNLEGEGCWQCAAYEKEIEKLEAMVKALKIPDTIIGSPEPGPIQAKPEPMAPFIFVCPNTDLHHQLVKKLCEHKWRPGSFIFLSNDEMALLQEIQPWPNPPRTASF